MTKHEHLAAYVECKSAVPGSADSILILFTHEQRDTIVAALRALSPPEPTEGLNYDEKVEMMRLADDIEGAEISDLDTEKSQIVCRALRIAGALRAMPLQDGTITAGKLGT